MVAVIRKFKQEFYSRFPNIRYMEFDSMDEMVQFLSIHHFQKSLSGHLIVPEKIPIPTKNLDDRVAVLSSVRGVSIKNAEDLLDKFGSIPKILRSRTTQKQLMAVKGIGRKKAKAILELRKSVY